jgi:hypothetical protein
VVKNGIFSVCVFVCLLSLAEKKNGVGQSDLLFFLNIFLILQFSEFGF